MKRSLLTVLVGLALSASVAWSEPVSWPMQWATIGCRDTVTMLGSSAAYNAINRDTSFYTCPLDISKVDPTAWQNRGQIGATNAAPDSNVAIRIFIDVTSTTSGTDTMYVGWDTSMDGSVWRSSSGFAQILPSGTNQFTVNIPFDARKKGGTRYGWLGQKYLRLKVHPGYVPADRAHGVKVRAFYYKADLPVQPVLTPLTFRIYKQFARDSVQVAFLGAGTSNRPDTTKGIATRMLMPHFLFPSDSINATLVSPDSIWAIKAMFEVTGAQNSGGDSLYIQWDSSSDGTTWRANTETWLGIVQAGSKFYEALIPFGPLALGGNRGYWGAEWIRFRLRGDHSGKQLGVKGWVYRWVYQ